MPRGARPGNSAQGIADHLRHLGGQAGRSGDTLQRSARVNLMPGVELPPAIEATRDPRCDQGIHFLQRQDGVGAKRLAATVGSMEVTRVGGAKTAQQGIDLVGIPELEGRMAHEFAHAGRGAGQR